jgi:hypothetical protein
VDEKSDHSCMTDITGKLDDRSIMEASMDPERRYQMFDKDT